MDDSNTNVDLDRVYEYDSSICTYLDGSLSWANESYPKKVKITPNVTGGGSVRRRYLIKWH